MRTFIFAAAATAFASLMVPAMAQTSSSPSGMAADQAENNAVTGNSHDSMGRPNTNSKTIASQRRHAMGRSDGDEPPAANGMPRPTSGALDARPEGSGPTSGR